MSVSAPDSVPWECITVITVAYNSAAIIGTALESIAEAKHITVVDNASTDDSISVVLAVTPHAQVIPAGHNLGYGRAVNLALKQVATEFVLLITPDVVVTKESVNHLLSAAHVWPNAGMVAPKLVETSGKTARCHDAALFHRDGMSRKRDNEPFPEGPLCAGYIQNAAVLVRMTALSEVGFYDPNIFLFFEDDDLCLRFIQRGWSLILLPDVSALHVEGSSTSEGGENIVRVRYHHMAWSRIYLERKHRGRAAGSLLGVRNTFLFFGKVLGALLVFDKYRFTRDMARLRGSIVGTLGYSAFTKVGKE